MAKPLSPHRYSGHYLEHRHTSYAALTFLLLVLGVVLLLATATVKADSSLDITAIVPGSPPTQAPTITSPSSGTHVTATPIEVTGDCTAEYRVAVYKNSVLAGSGLCGDDGTYSINIDLFDGLNDLTAQQYDFLDQASPLSAVVEVYFDAPTTGSTAGASTTSGSTATAQAQQFIIRTASPYIIGRVGGQFNWPVGLTGGTAPYALSWNWGDGTTNIVSISSAGSYTAQHTYATAGNYKVIIRGSDSKGATAYLQVLAIVDGTAIAGTANNTGSFDGGQLLILWPLYILMVVMLLCFWLGERYEFYKVKLRLREQNEQLI